MHLGNALKSDKNEVVKFCKNTFSWGDYISEIWDYWNLEGNLFVIRENDKPIALCHASISESDRKVWIEGIRVHPNFRRKGHAHTLVRHCEIVATSKQCVNAFMLIETDNKNSLRLSEKLDYKIKEIWNFFSIPPKKFKSIPEINFVKEKTPEFETLSFYDFCYVDSWRWYSLDVKTLSSLIKNNQIIFTKNDNEYSMAVITTSKHFSGTLILTLLFGNSIGIQKIINYSQHLAAMKNFKRIQILSQLNDKIPLLNFETKLSFYLVWKKLHQINS